MVLEVDPNKRRISLGLKQCMDNPWESFSDTYTIGSKIEGEIKNITEFGLFWLFDFSHNQALTLEELRSVETRVNAFIRQNTPVETRIMTPDDARAIGAQALFGEKYGDEVRVVSMGEAHTGKGAEGNTWSIELCGGTHVQRTGDIGVFVTLGDSASSSGVRRIEALTGEAAFKYLSDQDHRLAETALALKSPPEDVAARVKALGRKLAGNKNS